MNIQEIMDFFFHLGSLFFSKLYKIKDAIMGSLVYSIYAHFYLSKDIWKNVIEFFYWSCCMYIHDSCFGGCFTGNQC
jgi:hypothetical protein